MEPFEEEPHADIRPLAFLLGTWRGEGKGGYPTLEPFAYSEEMTFEHVGEPWLAYSQVSRSPEGEPLHMERGFIRLTGESDVELILAHPIGVAEIAHGQLSGTTIEVGADGSEVARTRTGLEVTGLHRSYRVEGNVLRYELGVSTEQTPMTEHLSGELRRVG